MECPVFSQKFLIKTNSTSRNSEHFNGDKIKAQFRTWKDINLLLFFVDLCNPNPVERIAYQEILILSHWPICKVTVVVFILLILSTWTLEHGSLSTERHLSGALNYKALRSFSWRKPPARRSCRHVGDSTRSWNDIVAARTMNKWEDHIISACNWDVMIIGIFLLSNSSS